MPVACPYLVAPLGDRGDCARVLLRGHSKKNKERRCRVEAVEEIKHRHNLVVQGPSTLCPIRIPHAPTDDLVPVLDVEGQHHRLPRVVHHNVSLGVDAEQPDRSLGPIGTAARRRAVLLSTQGWRAGGTRRDTRALSRPWNPRVSAPAAHTRRVGREA